MKLKSIFLLLLTVSSLFGAPETTIDWTKVSVSRKGNGQIRFLSGKKTIGFVIDSKKKNLGKAEIQNGFLILDTTGYKDSGTYAMIFLNAKKYPDQMVQLEFDLAGSENGIKVDFFFNGRLTNKKHYWKQHILTVAKNMQHVVLRQKLPNDLASLNLRIDFPSPGIYRLGNVKYGIAVQEKVDGSINHIPNGGAERGFYCIIPPTPKRYDGSMKVTLDSNEKHSGKYSFRLDAQNADYNRIVFNSVPYVLGKPASFSAWMRAEKPTTVDFMMFAESGNAYAKKFKVGKEWKKYTFTIPNYGASGTIPGVRTIGTPTNRPGYINPGITLPSQKNTVWIDDLAFQLNTETTEKIPPVYISGRLDEPRGYYRQGKPITANMKFESSGTTETAELEYELVNWRGEKIISTQKEKITLPLEKSFTFKVPEHLQGPMNLKFRVIAGKEVMTHNFYCGVISQDTVFNKRVGVNVYTRDRDGVQVTADLLKDFGIGAVRAWSTHPGLKNLDIYRKNGFYVMLCLSVPHTRKTPRKHWLFFPLDYTEYFAFLKGEIEKYYKNNVDLYEIFNEPNIWAGRSKNPDPSKYTAASPEAVVDGTIKIADFLKECDPGVPLAGPACCGTRAHYISNYLEHGADKAVQVITEHPYRFLPEQPDYEPDLKALQKAVKGKEIQSSESGSQTFGSWPNNEIRPEAITWAAKDIRMMIIGLANGVSRFYQFRAGAIEVQNTWMIFMGSGPDENNSWQPGIWCYAARNLASLIGEKSEASPVKLGFDYRCYIFDKGDERVAALWKWFGKPAGLVFEKPVSYLDMMGGSFTSKNIWLDNCPIYIRTKQSIPELSAMIRNALPDSSEDAPVKITADPSDAENFTLNLTNLTIRKLSGEVRLSTGETKKFSGLEGDSVLKLPFRAPKRITTVPQKLEATVMVGKHVLKQKIQLKAILVPQTEKKIVIDGDLSDWKQYTSIKLDSKNAVKLVPWNKDALRTKAEVRFCWDQEFLYLAVIADKKGFFPDKGIAPWKGDGIQVAFDTMRNADSTTMKYQDDDFEYSVWKRNGKTAVYRHYASLEAYDSLNKSLGLTSDVTAVIKDQGDRTVYEMAFSPVSISPFKLFSGSACRFDLILNMSDGKQRIGWLEIAPGLGQNPKKPGYFPDLILVK